MPNYQGVFLRGYGSQIYSQNNGSTIGVTATTYSSSSLGNLQGDALRNIYGNSGNGFDTESGSYVNGAFYSKYEAGAVSSGYGYYAHFDIMDVSRILPTANEIRPVNIAVRYLIKAK